MRAVFKRELRAYFMTPLGFIFLGVFAVLAGLLYQLSNVATLSSDLSTFFSMMSYLWMLLCPVLVMRLIAGDRKQQTDLLLLTAPIRSTDIVLGKYLAASALLLISVLLSLLYPLLTAIHGRAYPLELMTAYIGFTLQGFAFIAFDLTLSALASSPMSAALLCFGGNLLLWLGSLLGATGLASPIRAVLGFFSLYERMTPFLYGQLSFANMIFFLGFIVICLLVCVQLTESRRWSESL